MADTGAQPDDAALAAAWLRAAADPAVADRLGAIYAVVEDQVRARGPACWASGRCCQFEAAGHRLYTTGLEAAWCLLRLPAGAPPPTADAISRALASGGCPFQVANLCAAHAARPLGCRTYYCDASARAWQHELTERTHAMVRTLHTRAGVPYRYLEWRRALALLAGAGVA